MYIWVVLEQRFSPNLQSPANLRGVCCPIRDHIIDIMQLAFFGRIAEKQTAHYILDIHISAVNLKYLSFATTMKRSCNFVS